MAVNVFSDVQRVVKQVEDAIADNRMLPYLLMFFLRQGHQGIFRQDIGIQRYFSNIVKESHALQFADLRVGKAYRKAHLNAELPHGLRVPSLPVVL